MKKVLAIAIVALLATATVFAGVNFSGRFRQGYKFTFAEGANPAVSAWKSDKNDDVEHEAKLIMMFSDDNGVWTVNLKKTGDLGSDDKWAANASVDITKLLATKDIDMGDFSAKISLGNNTKTTALSAYTDPDGTEAYKVKNAGQESMQIDLAYAKLAQFRIGFDPTTAYSTGSVVVSAKTEPVDGVAVAVAYAYKGAYYSAAEGSDNDQLRADNVIGVSADVNVQKLADLDFKLGVSAYDSIALKVGGVDKTTANSFAANIYGGVDVVDGFVEFRMDNNKAADDTKTNVFGLKAQANFNFVENLGLDLYFGISNFKEAGDTFSVGGDVSYKIAGVEFALNAEYARANKAFSMTPKMIINF